MHIPNAIFIHSKVDDAGLTPAQFRVLCHVGRRDECYETVGNMASHCRLHADTVRKSLKELVKLGWLSIQRRPGTTTIYEVNHSKIREQPLRNKGRGAYEKKGGEGYENEGDKVYPIKVNPNKDICSSSDERMDDSSNGITAEDIYQQYPKPMNKPSALKAIKLSMRNFDPEHLMARTKLFAEVAAGTRETKFIKSPARWFEEECFNEEPRIWASTIHSSWGQKSRAADGSEIKKIQLPD